LRCDIPNPAAIADLKAAVRFIRSIAHEICGDPEKIIANGTSAGGALSALLAASGDSPLYKPYLAQIGAAEESDRIYYMRNTLIFNDPLHAIVTVEGSTVTVEGMETTMYLGVTTEMTDNPRFDKMGMPCEPVIRSAKFTLH
jgi:acetyl esterase/lipase